MIKYDNIEWNKSKTGYCSKRIDGKKWSLHRYVYNLEGIMPLLDDWVIHHIDGNQENNSINNLVQILPWCHKHLHQINKKRSGNTIINMRNMSRLKKPVLCIETGIIYQSTSDAFRTTGICRENISKVCLGKRERAGGYSWSFV